jgi:hypothetical protein
MKTKWRGVMDVSEIEHGKLYTYYPVKQDKLDNRHFPARVVSIGQMVEVILIMQGSEEGVTRFVSAERLDDQLPLIDLPPAIAVEIHAYPQLKDGRRLGSR